MHTGIALGARWSEIGTGLPPGAVAPVATLIIDPQTGSTLYAQTPGESIFKSTDGGESWKALSSIAGVRVLALDPISPSAIYAGARRAIPKSTNGGETGDSPGCPTCRWGFSLAVDPVAPSTVYAGAGTDGYSATQRSVVVV